MTDAELYNKIMHDMYNLAENIKHEMTLSEEEKIKILDEIFKEKENNDGK